MIEMAFFITAFTTLFVVIDPFGTAPIFVALTQGMDPATRRRVAYRTCLTASGILIAFAAFGEAVLGFVGISMEAFKVAGGALLFLTALDMLFERRQSRRENHADDDDHADDPSIFPMAIPLVAGPGSIATVILLAGQTHGLVEHMILMIILAAVIVFLLVFLISANYLERALGKTGIVVLTRLLGMLLAALAIQFMLDGLTGFGEGLTIIRGPR